MIASNKSLKPTSKKTRIETRFFLLLLIFHLWFKTDFQKNKDWNTAVAAGAPAETRV